MKKFFALIEVKENTSWHKQPKWGEYKNPNITKITPCTKKNGKYVAWETGKEEKVGEDTKVWPLYVGTCFRLKNGREVLISRDLARKEFLTEDFRFNPCTMVRYEAKEVIED